MNERITADVKVFPLVNKIPRRLRGPVYAAATFLSVSGVAATCGGGDKPLKTSELQPRLTYSLTLPFEVGETWWYTGGPHSDGLSGGVRYAIDVTPTDKSLPCPSSEPYQGEFVRAIADGVVTVVGNEKDPKDKNHSVVEIDHGEGFVSGYMHLADMQVEVGDTITQGDPLGYVSCEIVPGGKTEGEHLHLYAQLKDKPIEIDRVVMSGWYIEATTGNYQGTMKQGDQAIRTADTRRCGPSTYSIRECGQDEEIRNDISWKDPHEEYIATPVAQTVPTRAPVPTLAPVPTVAKPVIPTVRLATATAVVPTPTVKPELTDGEKKQQDIEAKMQKAQQLTQQFIDLLKAGGEQNIQAAFNMQLPESQKNRFNTYSLATLDTLRICSDEMINGEMQNIRLSRRFIPNANKVLTEAEKLNKERGLVARDVYSYGVTFLLNDWNSAAGTRIGFNEYDPVNHKMAVGFEDVNGQMLITQPQLCTAIGGPLAKTVYQLNSGQ